MNLKTERDKAMKTAYSFARSGNATWAQLWIERANDFLQVTPKQLAHAQRLLDKSKGKQR